jgi:DNA-binding NtrC family response regulator
MEKVVIIDDEVEAFLPALEVALEEYELLPAKGGADGLALIGQHPGVAAVLLDIKMPPRFGKYEDREGVEVLKRIVASHPGLPVIMLTVMRDVDLIVECMKEGAFYYLTKPPDVGKLLAVVREAAGRAGGQTPSEISRRNSSLASDPLGRTGAGVRPFPSLRSSSASDPLKDSPPGYGSLIGASAAMQRVYNAIERVALISASVLIMGASGTGKELVAREIHNRGPRKPKPFRPVNCAAIPKDLLESTLFGHKKGAFTGASEDRKGEFELAAGGTLFLDEIGDMPLELQAKLLRALEDKTICRVGDSDYVTVDVRIVSATNQDILNHIETRRFREDLYFRVNTIPVFLPALAERREDVPFLARHFLSEIAKEYGKGVKAISAEAMEWLMYQEYPGNVRQLRNHIARAAAMCEGDTLELQDFAGHDRDGGQTPPVSPINRGSSLASDPLPGQARDVAQDAWNRQTTRESAIAEMSEFRNRYGEGILKKIIERAVRQTGDVRRAGILLNFIPDDSDEKGYAAFRQWLARLGLSKKGILSE